MRHRDTRGLLVSAAIAAIVAAAAGPAVAQTTVEEARLRAPGGQAQDTLGWQVAIDGDTAVVGAPFDDGSGEDAGAAHVFVREAGGWIHQARLAASDAEADARLGLTVSVSGDTAIVGAPMHGSYFQGAAYVFTRSGGTWTQQAKLAPLEADINAQCGYGVAIQGDTLMISCIGADAPAPDSGAGYVFARSAGTWSLQGTLVASDAVADLRLGMLVDMDGDTIVLAAPWEATHGYRSGAAYVFTRAGGAWSQQAKLMASDSTAEAYFGWPGVSGNTLVVGSYGSGAYIFEREGAAWSERARLLSSDPQPYDDFGVSVAIDGGTVAVSASGYLSEGAVFVFSREGAGWAEQAMILGSEHGFGDRLGMSLAIHRDTIVSGAPSNDALGEQAGMAYVHRFIPDDDGDGDGLPDNQDPDTVAAVVDGLPADAFSSPGHANAIKSRLEDVEARILSGDVEGAIHELENLLRRLDGCPGDPTAGGTADNDDWVTDCDAQRLVRQAILDLIEALRGGA